MLAVRAVASAKRAGLSRDTNNAHEKLNTIFDKEKEQKRIEKTQLVGELGKQITDIVVKDASLIKYWDLH